MLYREIVAGCSEIHTKHINKLCGRTVELLSVKPDDKYRNHLRHQAVLCQLLNRHFCWLSQLESSECSLVDYKSSVDGSFLLYLQVTSAVDF
jgi:hypothetical protein